MDALQVKGSRSDLHGALRAPDSLLPRPRVPRPQHPGPHAAPESRICAPWGPPSPARANQQNLGWGAEPQATAEYQLVGPAVAHKVAPRTRLPLFPPPSFSEKTAVGPRRPPTTHRAEGREVREGGTAGRRKLRRRRRRAQPSQNHLRREQNGGAGGGPTVRRGRGHSPSAPTLTPARPVRGSRLTSPGAGREGRGAARPTMQSVRRRRHRPVAKVKGSGSAAATAPPCPRARPAPSNAGPIPPGSFFNFTSGFGAKAASKQVPCLRRAAPGAEGRARGGRAPGVSGWREPRGRRLAGQRARDETPRWERGRARGHRWGRGEGGVCYCFCQ